MPKFRPAPAVLVLACVISVCALAQDIHLKTRTLSPQPRSADELATTVRGEEEARSAEVATVRTARGSPKSIHQIVEFDHPPGVDDLDALLLSGAQVTGVLPDNAVMVSVPGRWGKVPAGAVWIGQMEAGDKISPALGVNTLLRRSAGRVFPVIVEFHADVDATEQAAVETSLGVIFLHPAGLLPQHAIVEATAEIVQLLAARDEVAYIFPADPGLLTGANTYPCAGMLTTAGTVAQYANITHGWDLSSDNIAHLSYYFGSLTPQVPAATVESEILRAFAQWAGKVNVTFQPATMASLARTIAVEFVSGAHGDAYPFTASGGMIAHTFYPVPVNSEPIAGDMHFNADEAWHTGADIDIYTVALHEAGHALGLTHSDNPGDVMYPYYQRGVPLSANDIGAALELYPAAEAHASSSTATSTTIITTTTTTGTTAALPPPLALSLSSLPATTQSAVISAGGSVTGGIGADSVVWQTDHGYTGNATVSTSGATTATWTAANIPLVTGVNTLTVTALSGAQVSTKTATVTLQKPTAVSVSPVTISIVSPVKAVVTVNAATMSVSGTAAGGAGITEITWQTSNGATGTACGTNTWIATGIPLLEGNTTVMLRAYDSTGANAWVAFVAVRP